MQKPLVTIMITTKNYGMFLEKSFQSVLDQSYRKLDIYLVDDFSKDNSKNILKKIKKKNPKVKIFLNSKSLGLQKISNKIIKICKGKFFLRLDADDWLENTAIKNMVEVFQKKKNIGAVYGNYYYANEDGNVIGYEKNLNIIKKHVAPHGACTMYKVNDLKKVDGYFTDVKAQDGWDAWLKLRDNIKYFYLKRPIFYYRQHQQSLTKTKKNILKERAKIFNKMAKKNFVKRKAITAVIAIKNSFENLKNVPFKKIGNQSLIQKQLNTLNKLDFISEVIFTTSNSRVLKYLQNNKAFLKKKKVFIFKRPSKFEKSISSLQEILNFTKKQYKKNGGNSEIFMFLNLHIIRNKFDHVMTAANLMNLSNFDVVFSVFKEKQPIFKFQKKEFSLLNSGRFNNLDFNSETIYKFNGSVICGRWEILGKGNMFKKKSGFVETANNEIIDINSLGKFK